MSIIDNEDLSGVSVDQEETHSDPFEREYVEVADYVDPETGLIDEESYYDALVREDIYENAMMFRFDGDA